MLCLLWVRCTKATSRWCVRGSRGSVVVIAVHVNPMQFGAGKVDAIPAPDDLALREILSRQLPRRCIPTAPRTWRPGPLAAELGGGPAANILTAC